MSRLPLPADAADDSRFEERISIARRLTEERQFADSIVLFDWLCETYPDRAAAIVDSANAFSRVFDYHGVQKRFAQVEAHSGAPEEVWLAMAGISQRLRRPQWARRFFSRAVTCAKPSAESCGQFALFLEHANELDPATELSERGLKIDPSDPSCQFALGKLYRRRGMIDQAERILAPLLKNDQAPPRYRMSACYEMAVIHDSRSEYQAAMDALSAGKRVMAATPEFAKFQQHSAFAQQTHHRFLTTLNEQFFKAADVWQPLLTRPIALLGGHPRSGTTLLEQILDSHSGIISAEETTVLGNCVFDPFIRGLVGSDITAASLAVSAERLEQLRLAYFGTMESVLDQSLNNRLLIDKNPSYTDSIPVIARVFPEAHYIIALRDPRDVVLSCFFQDLPTNEVTVEFQTVQQTAMRYANTMAMWLLCREQMDERKWIEVRYESLVKDLPGEAKKVMAKLNLPWQQQQERPQDHARTKPVISPTYAEVTKPVHTNAIGKWKRYEPWLADAMPILETFIEAFDY